MLDESLPVTSDPGCSSSEVITQVGRARSATASTGGSQPRYYRSADTGIRPEPHPDPDADSVLRVPVSSVRDNQETLEMTRLEALHTIDTCRHVIAALELTRLRKSRTGMYSWIAFWERLYERSFANLLASRVMSALYKVDALFRAVSFELHQLAQRTELAVASASSEKEILHILGRMEEEVNVRRRRRRRKAQNILEKMRTNMEAIPVKVSDELFDDMKRGVFALDVFGDYHPGDPQAEQAERMWHQHFIGQPVGLVRVSPYLYGQLRTSTASNTSLPLTAYSSNPRWTDTVEWVNEGVAEVNGWVSHEGRRPSAW
ncbi:uncharacterized protein BJX67DRAFT_305282 [Aspergillus lucknowensis]|uniref:Uncharacterized protein n=1 Tax=Aspergillus lucknowensis TaxID=176173 RepID=A0ABR4M2R9_9EURO